MPRDDPPPNSGRDTPAAAVLAAAETLDAMLSIALGLVVAGRRVDLAGLEQEAARLCAAAAICPAETVPQLRGALAALLPRLDTLSMALRPD
ncbi:hypothetical protein C8P66_12113 [Humitalea rosea]|uniref:Class II flagellar assembly regulator n=1 Tax=Humitalea rosea TaxID=990373 RepID=A0A2W7I3F6_9PROT|nr:hypothetical protein [Humitalea rosea]PZW41306.1 hypothetical protein C8P66_12113 [Humitalea rosea]